MGWLTLVLLIASVQVALSFIFPMKKPDGSVDFDSIVNHIGLLEQNVAILQQDSTAQKTEISALKAKVVLLQSQLGTGHLTSEVTSLKDELFATKTELRSVSSEVISVNAGLKTMASEYSNLQVRINDTNKIVENLKNTSGIVRSLQQETAKLQAEVNSTRTTLKDQELSQNKVLQALNMTTKDTTMLKTNVALLNTSVITMMQNVQTTSNIVSGMSPIVDRLNAEVWFQVKGHNGYTAEKPIKFDNVVHNVGGGYSSASGVFTAPVSGVYLFWSQIDMISGSWQNLNLFHNGQYVVISSTPPFSTHITNSVISAADVTAGDTMYVTSSASGIHHTSYVNFGGVLLRKH